MFFPTPKQMKTIESNSEKNGVSCSELMRSAGEAVTLLIYKISRETDLSSGVVFICGSGNNGGDGFVAAHSLAESGIPITVVLACGDPTTELAGKAYCDLSEINDMEVLDLNDNVGKVFERFSKAAVIVDAVFGTGMHGYLPPQVKACFSYAERCEAIKIAADVPSGGDCLRGTVAEGTLKCDYTVTFGYKKVGMLSAPLDHYCGEIVVADIGITDKCCKDIEYLPTLYEEGSVSELFPKRPKNCHKGSFGRLLNISGCASMSGAALLSTNAALRSGAGLVTLASTGTVINRIASAVPEATYLPLEADKRGAIAEISGDVIVKALKNKTAVSAGCGLSVTDGTKSVIKRVIKEADCPIILDADGINCIADNIDIIRDTKNKLIITPHIGELARLSGVSHQAAAGDRLTLAVNIAREYGAVVVAKGVPTFVAGRGRVYVIPAGNPGLARGGSGDVLTGIIASFAAQGIDPLDAAAAGVYIHGAAADCAAEELSEICMLPSDVIRCLSVVFKKMNR
ncbi:MAG: NAD(P)H-hydrate dehydratase [Oscillospiraceae bacterium]|nr:NAD(P)H-hydrate dehydratase [Oscillospiraceae bacterium]